MRLSIAAWGLALALLFGAVIPAQAQICTKVCRERDDWGNCSFSTTTCADEPSSPLGDMEPILPLFPKSQPRAPAYGAIAYSRGSGSYGTSHNFNDRATAERTAQAYCLKYAKDCEAVVWFANNCGAVAADGPIVTWALGPSEAVAQRNALQQCGRNGGKACKPAAAICSR